MSESHTIGSNVLRFRGPEIVFGRKVDPPNEPMMSGSGSLRMSLSSAPDVDVESKPMQVQSIIKGDRLCRSQRFIKHTSLCQWQTGGWLSPEIALCTQLTEMCTSVNIVDKFVNMQKTGEL
jgi:hypothetical protein